MASGIINRAKESIIKKIVEDDVIVQLIDSPYQNEPGWDPSFLIDSDYTRKSKFKPHIFDYHRHPETIEEAITFLTIQLNVTDPVYRTNVWMNTNLIITIVSHQNHMRIGHKIPTSSNRNDYLSLLIDDKINDIAGDYGTFTLISNNESIVNNIFMCRQLIFETQVNTNKCDVNYELDY